MAILLVIYLVGVICTVWCPGVPPMSRDHRPFLSASSVIWPFTVTVFGAIVLLALLAHWYDRLALTVRERFPGKALPSLPRRTLQTTDSQAKDIGGRRHEKWNR